MRTRTTAGVAGLVLPLMLAAGGLRAAEAPTGEQVRQSMQRAIAFLLSDQNANGGSANPTRRNSCSPSRRISFTWDLSMSLLKSLQALVEKARPSQQMPMLLALWLG